MRSIVESSGSVTVNCRPHDWPHHLAGETPRRHKTARDATGETKGFDLQARTHLAHPGALDVPGVSPRVDVMIHEVDSRRFRNSRPVDLSTVDGGSAEPPCA